MTTITVVAVGRVGAGPAASCRVTIFLPRVCGARGRVTVAVFTSHHIVTIPDTGHIVPSGPRIPTAATDTNAHNTLA